MANILTKTKSLSSVFVALISLSTPLSRVIIFSCGLITLTLLPTDKLYLLPVRSLYETVFKFSPYSSGMTRGLSKLLHGDFYGAYTMNKLSYIVLAVIIILLIKDICYLLRTREFTI